ncbi:hypothetical protein NPIL_392391 [Nephila pilipes]|uniref:Uncharacterized protein n=1 Tax=Nephila pilipes TaxID=299642 RepID=A0A8X6N8B4_NEPPI|nr:hypothetical protein NPIL_392391 [Nephila pilipes]
MILNGASMDIYNDGTAVMIGKVKGAMFVIKQVAGKKIRNHWVIRRHTLATRRLPLKKKVPPRFELGSLDSKSRVLTITPWNHSSHAGNRTRAAWVKARNPNH